MENYEPLAILVFIVFLVTVGLIITKKVEFVRALPAFGIITAILAGVPISGSENSIADFVIVQGATSLSEIMFIYILAMMFACFLLDCGVDKIIDYLFMHYCINNLKSIVWIVSLIAILLSSVIANLGAVILVAIIFVPILLKIGFNKQSAVALILLSTSIGSCLNPGYHLLYTKLLLWDIEQVKNYYYIMATFGIIALITFIGINIKYVNRQNCNTVEKMKVNWPLLLVIIIPVVIMMIFNLNIECAIILALSYGLLVNGSKNPFMDMLELLKLAIAQSINVIILLASVGIFMHAVKTPEVINLMAPLLLKLMPNTPIQCLLFFTVLSPLVLYKGPFNLQGMGAGLSSVIIASTSMNPMVLAMALLSLNNLRKMMDPLDTQNIALMQYVEVDTNLVIKKILPYALGINYFMLFYALVAVI